MAPAAETQPLLRSIKTAAPKAPWSLAIRSSRDPTRFLPQTIAHRGYRAAWPENTMRAFKGAVEVGAHAIETDVHLTADGVVVLSHDGDLKRCYGVDKKVGESSWEYLSTLRTVAEPHEPLPRLLDLLEWLAEPGQEKTWVLLDIKIDDKAEDLLTAIKTTIATVPSTIPWENRLVLGCWNASFLRAARQILPDYSVAHITFSLTYARHFLSIPNIGFNMLQKSLIGPPGARFLRQVKAAGSPVYAWTVNDVKWMEWCLNKNLKSPASAGPVIDGVISDDPKLFREVCERWEDELDGKVTPARPGIIQRLRSGLATAFDFAVMQIIGTILHFRMRYIDGRWDLLKDH